MTEEKTLEKIKGTPKKFVKIRCKDCSNEQVVFSRISTKVACNVCGSTLAEPTGGLLSTYGEFVGEA
ncbi:MAG: 30S ribosomal protein S27e [Candidatus Thermoplasmatota archaeon]|jgi:small subunit ribosomal protein S27e|nr:30S ribosomal protein S27e [Candidatus Thermoplasmatota archaeon]MCL5785572.1 30S ribosomal protein S27e [Candidatus Thermoplasmatota archaeon]